MPDVRRPEQACIAASVFQPLAAGVLHTKKSESSKIILLSSQMSMGASRASASGSDRAAGVDGSSTTTAAPVVRAHLMYAARARRSAASSGRAPTTTSAAPANVPSTLPDAVAREDDVRRAGHGDRGRLGVGHDGAARLHLERAAAQRASQGDATRIDPHGVLRVRAVGDVRRQHLRGQLRRLGGLGLLLVAADEAAGRADALGLGRVATRCGRASAPARPRRTRRRSASRRPIRRSACRR